MPREQVLAYWLTQTSIAVPFDPKLRDQVVERYDKLNLPVYWAGIDADLRPDFDKNGRVTRVWISYPRDYVAQRLGYSAMYVK